MGKCKKCQDPCAMHFVSITVHLDADSFIDLQWPVVSARDCNSHCFHADNNQATSSKTQPLFAMSGDGKDGVKIPMVFLFYSEGQELLTALKDSKHMRVYMGHEPKTSGGASLARCHECHDAP